MNQTKLTYKQQGNVGLFDSDETMEKLNAMGNPLDKLSKAVDFEMFRDTLERGLYKEKFTKVGAKPYDYVLMFKIVVLQRIYHLSDPQAEYQIRDRLSFRDFLGLASGDKVPDEKTIWAFKEELTKKGLFGQLFNEFYAFLEENNLILHEGTMIDGSFVEAPRQHNTREENKIIKEDRGGEKHFGYKNHTKVDKGSKFIKKGVTTDASVYDSKPVKELVDENDRGEDLFADSAYIGKGVKRVMRKFGMKDMVIKRNTRGKKISKWQETINRKNSKLRVSVEHVFGYMEECLHGMSSRVVGFARNAAYNTLTNLVYNLCRYEQIMRLGMN